MVLKIHENQFLSPDKLTCFGSYPKVTHGFTLIELVVAVTISLVVTGMTIVNYNTYNTKQSLKQAALTLKNDLRFLQAKAKNGEKPSSCSKLIGWLITFSSSSYSYEVSCDGVYIVTPTVIQLTPGISFSPLPSPNPFTFQVLTRGTSLVTPLLVILSGSGNTYTIQISPSGDINDLGIH